MERPNHKRRRGNHITSLIARALLGGCLGMVLVAPAADGFSLFGSAWLPGPNTARQTATPTPGGATWSIMGAGFTKVLVPGVAHSGNLTVAISSLLGGGEAAIFGAALDIWAGASGFTNLGQVADGAVNAGATQAAGGHLGDIRFAAWETDFLAHAFQPGTEAVFGPGGTIGGDAHFDVNRTWVNNPNDVGGNGQFDLFTLAIHEVGHSLGVGHSLVVGSVMEPLYAGSRRTLHADDMAGIQALYGVNQVIPEPHTALLVGLGLVGLLTRRRWRRRDS